MMEKRKKANPNCLQLSLGSKQNAVNLILNGHDKNFQIFFGSKDGKKSKIFCPGQREIWIPPPGKTARGKRKSCCLYNEIMLSLPEDGKFVLPYESPLIIESQHLENFKAALYPPRPGSASVHSCDSSEDQSKRIRQNYEKQYMVAKESEKLLKEHNNRRKVLLKHITLLKRNLEEINKSIQEIESDVTGAQWCSKRSSSDAKTKSLLTEAKNLENIMKQKMKGKEQFDCNIPSNLSSEKVMMNLADNMRKSKMLLDNTLQEKEAINDLQTKYIQGVEELFEGQHRLLKRICQALDTTSSSEEDRNVDDNASSCSGFEQELQLSHKTEKLKFNSLPDLANYLQNQNLAKKLTLANSQLDKLKTELESIKMKSQENKRQLDMNSRQMFTSGQKRIERKISETTVTHKTKTISNTPENENNVLGNFQAENLPSLYSAQKAMEKLKETLEKIIPIMPKESEMTPVVVNHHEENISVKPISIRQRKSKRVEKMDSDRSNTQTDSSNDEVQQSDENAVRSSSGTMPAAGRENVYKGSSEDEGKVALRDSSGFETELLDLLLEKQTVDDNELITARRKQEKHQDQMTALPDVTRRPQMDKQGRRQTARLDSSTFKPQNESSRLSSASRRARILPKQQSIRYRKKASVTGRPDVSEEFFPNLIHVGSSELNEKEASSLNKSSDKLLDQGFIDATPAYTERFSDDKSKMRDPEGKVVPGTSDAIADRQPLNDLNTRIDSYNRFSEEKYGDLTSVNQRIKPSEQVSHDDKSKLGHMSNREKYGENASFQSSMNTNDRLISGFISNVSQYEESPPDKPPEQVSHGDKSKLGHISNQEKYQKDASFQSSMNTNDRLISGIISNISQYEEPPPDKPPEQLSHGDKSKLGHVSNREKYQKDASFQSSINSNDRLISGFISNVSHYEESPPDKPPEPVGHSDKSNLGHISNREKYQKDASFQSSINSNDRLISGFISNISQYEESPPDNKISNPNDELISRFISDSSQCEDPSNNSRVHDANDRQTTPQNRKHLILSEKAKEATPEGRSHVPLPYGAPPLIRVHDNKMTEGNDSEEWHVPELYYGSLDSTNDSEHWHVPEPYYGSSLDSSKEYFGNTTSSPRRSKVDRGMDIDDTQGSEHWYRLDSYHGSSFSPSVLEEEVFYNGFPETQRQNTAENGVTRQPEKDLLSDAHNRQKLRSKSIPVSYDRYRNEVSPGYERVGQNGLRNYPQRRVTYYTTGIPNTKPKFYDSPRIPSIKDPNIRSKSVAAPLYSSAGYNDMTSRRHTLDWNKIQQKKIRNLYNEIMR